MEAVGTSSPWLRVMLLGREALRVEKGFQQLRVRSGKAWITLGGRDLTMPGGEGVALDAKSGPAVVTPLGSRPVVIELRRRGSTLSGSDDALPEGAGE